MPTGGGGGTERETEVQKAGLPCRYHLSSFYYGEESLI